MKILFMICTLISFSVQANNFQHSYFKKDLPSPHTLKQSKITKAEFKELLKKIKKAYTKQIWKRGGVFIIKDKWRSNRVNAYASRIGPLWKLTALGGLARHPMIDYDGYALVLCHEMGHHLGGAPKSTVYFKRWVSFEGQADYWATLKCFRTLFKADDNIAVIEQKEVSPWVRKQCSERYADPNDSALCIRSILAGQTMANLIADYHGVDFPQAQTPDPKIVEKTSFQHPSAQCRFDTYIQGALCPIGDDITVDPVDRLVGTCNRKQGHELGNRPLCWYNPEN